MFRTFKVERFRGLRRCELDDLRRVTLLTGTNNAGKTALLEAMFIHSGRYNPELALRVNAFRGLTKFAIDSVQNAEKPWQSLFTDYLDERPISFSAEVVGPKANSQEITVQLSTIKTEELRGLGNELRAYSFADISAGAANVLKLQISGTRATKKPEKYYYIAESKQQSVVPKPPPLEHQARYLSAHRREEPDALAMQFSRLQLRNQVGLLINALRIMEPRLESLELLFVGEPLLHGGIGLVGRRLIPLALMGDGMNRVATLLLAISETQGGVVLVDDIDTGLHHSVMEGFWGAIFRAAQVFDVQLVATTHSEECVKAALAAANSQASDEGDEFRLVRLERRTGHVAALTFSATELATAFEANIEVR